ncbi:MAG: hypothetical protein PHC30_08085 [Lentisphaeria bacterium]|nr:hypothetical protein [Lentisphaeria bacterium]
MPDSAISHEDAVAKHDLIKPEDFAALMAERAAVLLYIARDQQQRGLDQCVLTRPFLSVLQAEATQLEEILDAYGARNNITWYPFRVQTAVLKNFSNAGYELLHLHLTSKNYALLSLPPDFQRDTLNAIAYVTCLISCSLKLLLKIAGDNGIAPPASIQQDFDFTEELPSGMLPRNRTSWHNVTVKERVLKLATNFLHSTVDAKFFKASAKIDPADWRKLNFDWLNETTLREQEIKFHNLQSLYDTYVSDSETEASDPNLPLLRGHISAVLHLLRTATIFVHFYERHVKLNRSVLFCHANCPLDGDWFFSILTGYLTRYASEFLTQARTFCQQILARYPKERKEVPVPLYLGFHVRPSTLVAAIVRHYGGDVAMHLDDNEYDASEAAPLIHANGWIDQKKREYIFAKLRVMDVSDLERLQKSGAITMEQAMAEVFNRLHRQNLIIFYSDELPYDEITAHHSGTLRELVRDAITDFQTARRINVNLNVTVAFQGNKLAIDDIAILAANDYGENPRGEDIALPRELEYLNHIRAQPKNPPKSTL